MVKIAALDDQREDRDIISAITADCMHEMGIPYVLKTYERARDLLYDVEDGAFFDIFLLDVEMEEMTGIEVARRIRKTNYESVVIYITNYVDYAIDAYEVNAYRYIPKKLLKEKLPEAYKVLLEIMEEKLQESFVIEKNHQLERIPYNEIYYLKKDGKNTLIFHKKGTAKVRIAISELTKNIRSTQDFLMIDKSYAVNIWHVMSLRDQQVVLRDGSILPVSSPRLKQVKSELMKHWR